MTNVLLINGSPRGEHSHTLRLARAFCDGIAAATPTTVREVLLTERDIRPCTGCFACWERTPGDCVIHDDMDELRPLFLGADVIVESFPLYFFGMPSKLKTMTDRMLPFMQPYRGEVGDTGRGGLHELRADLSGKRLAVISTCGYAVTEGVYDALDRELDLICGAGRGTRIYCPQGEILGLSSFQGQIDRYLDVMRRAGAQVAVNGYVDETLQAEWKQPLLPQRAFQAITTAHWDRQIIGK